MRLVVSWFAMSAALVAMYFLADQYGLFWELGGWAGFGFGLASIAVPVVGMLWALFLVAPFLTRRQEEPQALGVWLLVGAMALAGAVGILFLCLLWPARASKARELQANGLELVAEVLHAEYQRNAKGGGSCVVRLGYVVNGRSYEANSTSSGLSCADHRKKDLVRIRCSSRYPQLLEVL